MAVEADMAGLFEGGGVGSKPIRPVVGPGEPKDAPPQ
jgi:hypothetical protein